MFFSSRFSLFFACALFVSATLTGCGGAGVDDAPEVYVVKGKLTKAGAPLPNVTVGFVPTSDGIGGTGTSGDDGSFEIQAGHGLNGMPAGNYAVVLSKLLDSSAYEGGGGDPTSVDLPFSAEYQDPMTTPKRVDVKADENNFVIDIE